MKMIIPIRCFSCGKPVAGYYQEFKERMEKGEDAGKIMDDMKLKRYCCRKMLLTSIDLTEEVMKYQK
jgi:DNA-directed RNA polymerase subunit N